MPIAVLNGLPPTFENLIVVLDAMGDECLLFIFDFVKCRLLPDEQRCKMHDIKAERSFESSALVNGTPT